MSESSKSLDLRTHNQQLAVIKPTQSSQNLKTKKKILEEDEFVKGLEKIIERDFFPDLERLRLQREYLAALESNDLVTLRELYSKYRMDNDSQSVRSNRTIFTPATFETPELGSRETPKVNKKPKEFDDDGESSEDDEPFANREPPKKRLASDLTLDKYLTQITSEDNISFEVIMDEAAKKDESRVHRAWLFDQEKTARDKNALALALPSYETQMIESNNNLSSTGGVIDTWSYTPKNTLMYIPEGVPLTFEEKLEIERQAKIIKHENTRFTVVPFDFKKQKETLESLSETRLSQLSGKMGVDGKELVSKETPKVNGFGFVAATPSPVPGRLAGDESPMMTWGEIDSTPFRLDGSATPSFSYHSGNGPEFKIPDIPEREKIALNLEEKANAARRKTKLDALKHVQRRIASPSVDSSKGSLSDRYHVMSPAAQRLLSSKLNIRPGSGVSMSGRQANLNNSAFLGLDLSLSGSPLIPAANSVNEGGQTPKKANRPTSASSSRSYIIPRTKSTENLAKKPDSGRSSTRVDPATKTNGVVKPKYPVPTTPSRSKQNDGKSVKDSVDHSRQSNAFKQISARSSYDDMSINTSSNKNEQKQNGNFESMFLLDEFKKDGAKPPRNNSTIFKDSLDVSNSVVKPPHMTNINSNNNQASLIIDEDEAWKNEMMIYEKYLKDDLETYGKQLNEFDNVNASKAFSTKSSIQSNHQNSNKNICNEESKEKIEKLKTSVDHLRREFHTDMHKIDAKFSVDNKNNSIVLNEIKRKISARKIQRWYRRHHLRIKAGEAALKRLMAQKKEEISNREREEKEKKEKEALLEKQKKEKASQHLRQQRIKELSKNKEEPPKLPNETKNSTIVKSSIQKLNNDSKPMNSPKKEKQDNNFLKSSRSETNSIKTELLVENKNHVKESTNTLQSESFLDCSTKSKTIDNLFETLKELEKVESFPSPPRSSNSLYESNDTLIEEKTEKSQINSVNDAKIAASMTNQKLNSILSFLDDVDTENVKSIPPKHSKNKNTLTKAHNDLTAEMKKKPLINNFFEHESQQQTNESENKTANRPHMKLIAHVVPSAEEIEDLEKATQSAAEVTNTMLSQRLELEEKKRTISMLQKALNQQRELTIRHTKEADKELEARLDIQKQEYEATIQRHLSFIDQLIDDKKSLSEKCEKLVKELKEIDKKYSDRIRSLEETFRIETQKMKDMQEAAEKLRREKWIEDKTKKIKEMTVKGLEPEIQNLIGKHKNEIKTLKSIHEAELLQADERASQRYIRMIEEMRQNFEQEKELSVNKEREMAKQRYEKSLQDEEKSFLEQRRRLYAEIEEEKNRIAEQGAKQRLELDRLRKNLEENNMNAIDAMKKEYEAARTEQERRHQSEMKEVKQRVEIEKQAWEENYMKKQETILAQKERELREQVKRDRDKEIELVLSRLESETALTRDESERAADNRVKRIRDKYETELREVEKTERETTERYNTIKAKYNELEGEHERFKVVIRQKDKELEDIHRITETLQQERSRLADIIRQEFSDRLVFTEEDSKRIKLEMAELKSKHQYDIEKKKEEIERLQREKDEELNKVHERIKQAIAKKEEVVSQLKQQYEAACKRADHLEGLLEQQRKLMVGKK